MLFASTVLIPFYFTFLLQKKIAIIDYQGKTSKHIITLFRTFLFKVGLKIKKENRKGQGHSPKSRSALAFASNADGQAGSGSVS